MKTVLFKNGRLSKALAVFSIVALAGCADGLKEINRPTKEGLEAEGSSSSAKRRKSSSSGERAESSSSSLKEASSSSSFEDVSSSSIVSKYSSSSFYEDVESSSSFSSSSFFEEGSSSSVYFDEEVLCGGVEYDAETQLCDERDFNVYNLITIGGKTWMAENLKYELDGSSCYECDYYGRLYNWQAAMEACPAGWSLPADSPSNDDIKTLVGYPNDMPRFLASLGGYKYEAFLQVGKEGNWWTAKSYNNNSSNNSAYEFNISSSGKTTTYLEAKYNSFSVRCVKD